MFNSSIYLITDCVLLIGFSFFEILVFVFVLNNYNSLLFFFFFLKMLSIKIAKDGTVNECEVKTVLFLVYFLIC